MTISDKTLRALLTAGSARAFDLQGKHRQLQAEKPKDLRSFFTNRNANRLVIIKYAPSAPERKALVSEKAVQTKLYLPFNHDNLLEGGKTIFLTDAKLEAALAEQLAMSTENDAAGYARDRRVLQILDELPSLDPFLMRDKFEIEQIQVDPGYFVFPAGELDKIKLFVREKMTRVAEFAAQDHKADKQPQAVERLTQILWEAKDVAALAPFTKAFGIPPTSAPEIVYAWKGVIFYDYEYSRQTKEWQGMMEWLTSGSRPRDGLAGSALSDLNDLRRGAIDKISHHMGRASKLLEQYRFCFDELFLHKRDAKPFVGFLRDAKRSFWDLGDSISRLSHSHAVWDRTTERFPERRLPALLLTELLDAIYRVNAE